MRESKYLSFNKVGDWNKGVGALVDWSDGSVKIASRKQYVLDDVINCGDYGVSPQDEVIVSTSGMIYLLKADGDLYGFDWQLKQMDLLDYNIGLAEEGLRNKEYFAAQNRIYCLNQKDNHIEIRIYSLLNRCWIKRYEVEVSSKLKAVSMNNEILALLDETGRFTWYDINKGQYKATLTFTEEQLPNIDSIVAMEIKGVDLHLMYEGDRHGVISLTQDEKTFTFLESDDREINDLVEGAKSFYKDSTNRLYVFSEDLKLSIYRYTAIYGMDNFNKVTRGTFYFPIIDSKMEGNQWHRLILKGQFPEKSHINLRYFAFDREKLKPDQRLTMTGLLEASSYTFSELDNLFSSLDFQTIENSDDFLFQNSFGRYMIIKLELIGSREKTPALEKARVYVNRETYSQYLPEIYQTGAHKDFLERFLSIFESLNLEIEEQVDLMARNFNPETASDDFLRWMLDWMDFKVTDNWSTEKSRVLIKIMPKLQRRRGTGWAIKKLLELFLEADIKIVETSKVFGEGFEHTAEMTEILESHYGNSPYSFTVLCNRKGRLSDSELGDVKAILDQETPPYCQYQFIELEHGLFLDKHTYLGLNTVLSDYSNFILDDQTLLPFNTLLLEE